MAIPIENLTRNFANFGQAVAAQSTRTGEVTNPSTGRVTRTVPYANAADVEADALLIATPEYNGSIPGVLKVMLDISDYKKTWWGKKALLTGVATGRSGNLRGMEHLTGILHYLRVNVHPNKLPISSVDKLLNGEGLLHDAGTLQAIDVQLDEFIQF